MTNVATQSQIEKFVAEQNAAVKRLTDLHEKRTKLAAGKDSEWQVKGTVGVASAFVYSRVTGKFDLSSGKTLGFIGDLGGLGVAGGESHGTATFEVPVEELLDDSVFVTAHFLGLVAAGFVVTWGRNFKHLGAYAAPGIGIGIGTMYGSGRFSLS